MACMTYELCESKWLSKWLEEIQVIIFHKKISACLSPVSMKVMSCISDVSQVIADILRRTV